MGVLRRTRVEAYDAGAVVLLVGDVLATGDGAAGIVCFLHVAVQHTGAPEEAGELRQMVAERFNPAELLTTEFSPVMSSYAGRGLLGLAFYEDADEP